MLKSQGRFPHTCSDPVLSSYQRLAILTEEVGEVASAIMTRDGLQNDRDQSPVTEELIQVAAVCLAWLEAMDP